MTALRDILIWLEAHLQLSIPKQALGSGIDADTLRRWYMRQTACPQLLKMSAYLSFVRRSGHRLNPALYIGENDEVAHVESIWLEPGESSIPHDWDVTLYVSGRTRAHMLLFWRHDELVSVHATQKGEHKHLDEMYHDLAVLAVSSVRRQVAEYQAA